MSCGKFADLVKRKKERISGLIDMVKNQADSLNEAHAEIKDKADLVAHYQKKLGIHPLDK
jgi:hypothetical protein